MPPPGGSVTVPLVANLVVIGMQWGDEGKGKVVDLLCPAFDVVARFQGGNNAGHTVRFGDRHFALHLIPSGILHPGTRCVAGNGMVIDLEGLFAEIDGLAAEGIDVAGSLFVSDRAHLVLPVHRRRDHGREEALGEDRIGTTGKGIGPAYESKINRSGMRVAELLAAAAPPGIGDGEGKPDDLSHEQLTAWAERLRPLAHDTSRLLNEWIDEGQKVLFEGAQGTLLDIDHGTYPFVTSSSSTAGGAATGTGVPPARLGPVLGVLKAYTTRVGAGPFVGELTGPDGEDLRRRGHEFGTTTGRPRRCGWLDAVAARYARRINGVGAIALTKLDILDPFDEVRVLTAYRVDGRERRDFPATVAELERAEPVFTTLPGWRTETTGALTHDELPAAARDYVAFIEREVGAPVCLISSGPRREETVLRRSRLAAILDDGLEKIARRPSAA